MGLGPLRNLVWAWSFILSEDWPSSLGTWLGFRFLIWMRRPEGAVRGAARRDQELAFTHGPRLTPSLCCLTYGWTLTPLPPAQNCHPAPSTHSSGPRPGDLLHPSLGPFTAEPSCPPLLIWTIRSYNSIHLFNFVAFFQRQEGPHSVPNVQQAVSEYAPEREREPGSWAQAAAQDRLPLSAQSSLPGLRLQAHCRLGHQRLWLKDRITAGSGEEHLNLFTFLEVPRTEGPGRAHLWAPNEPTGTRMPR